MTQALQKAGIPYREGEPLSRHTTMGVGGAAAVMAFPRSSRELQATLQVRADLQVPHRVLGGGSNLVVADEGLAELLSDATGFCDLTIDDAYVHLDGTLDAVWQRLRTSYECAALTDDELAELRARFEHRVQRRWGDGPVPCTMAVRRVTARRTP